MNISYETTKRFEADALRELFLSVEWSSGHYPDKLVTAMANSGAVFTARDGDRLIGLVNALDDGTMTAYVPYVLVNPAYQGKGIGKALMKMLTDHYRDYLRIVLISYDDATEFYRHCGFAPGDGKTPMFVTSLWT